MAKFTISIQMNIVGSGEDEATARAAAAAQYVDVISSLCEEYGYEGEVLADGLPTPEAVLFARRQVTQYLSEVVKGWKRRKAIEEAAASVVVADLNME